MLNFVLILAALLVLGIFIVAFRVSTLSSVVKSINNKGDEVGSGNSLHGYLFVLLPLAMVAAGGWYGYKYYGTYVLPYASQNAELTEPLFLDGYLDYHCYVFDYQCGALLFRLQVSSQKRQ